MTDLVEWLRVQLDADEASEWPHRPSCQMVKQPGLSCNCDAADRWRRDIDAKRKILALTRFDAQFPDSEGGYDSACEDVIKLLAEPYADRPGYQESWRP